MLNTACPDCVSANFPCRAHLGDALAAIRAPLVCECCGLTGACDCEIQPMTDTILRRLANRQRLKCGLICILHKRWW